MTDSYEVIVKKSAERELRTVSKQDLRRITERLLTLSQNPRQPGCEKLSGQDQYRIRQGDYRVVYEIDDVAHIVTVVKIGHRREVYR
ncbi:MAG TPA: type II toxin-antitoxin system RelE/ParE family toxin [Nitrospira sp.]|nr:type II toxin-antitoxin system RelE/ParE family toxin [Nitrospira sp.]